MKFGFLAGGNECGSFDFSDFTSAEKLAHGFQGRTDMVKQNKIIFFY